MKIASLKLKAEITAPGISGTWLGERNRVDMELLTSSWVVIRSLAHPDNEPVLVPIENVANIVPQKGEYEASGFGVPVVKVPAKQKPEKPTAA